MTKNNNYHYKIPDNFPHNLHHYKGSQQLHPSEMVNRGADRRETTERRAEIRTSGWQLRFLALWFKSIFKPRLGVDRRKGERRASRIKAEHRSAHSVLTAEELHHLLKD